MEGVKFTKMETKKLIIIQSVIDGIRASKEAGWSLKPILDSMVKWGNEYRENQK